MVRWLLRQWLGLASLRLPPMLLTTVALPRLALPPSGPALRPSASPAVPPAPGRPSHTPPVPGLSISLTLRNESGRCHMTPVFIGCSGGRFLFGTARMFAVFRKPDRRREFAQSRRQCGRRHRSEHLPVGCRDRHHHAVVGLADLQRQIIAGHVIVALWLPMNTVHRGL